MDHINSNVKCPKIINRNIELRPNNLFTETNINPEPIQIYSKLNKKKPYKSYGPSKSYGKEVLKELSQQPKLNMHYAELT
ncbi:hypothetical protein BpHYR1_013659 [Brachionus plicatilis]|uniref:Uncharacterized protein n=1 Tax=Brachionus plicatilis TaxID=10195 RepID=A0A3M7SX76_BRAPC|nr:hypothetical protein BpHYR1_013659 [Brachionus plicatilis]